MEGRWTIARLPDCDIVQGPRTDGAIPVVPCDDAAIERVAVLLFARSFIPQRTVKQVRPLWDDAPDSTLDATREAARGVLRAAGETP